MIFRHLLNMRSHPTWVRGLKPFVILQSFYLVYVAPYVGAWIETERVCIWVFTFNSRTLRGCVD